MTAYSSGDAMQVASLEQRCTVSQGNCPLKADTRVAHQTHGSAGQADALADLPFVDYVSMCHHCAEPKRRCRGR
jgi:hypothetical protein